MKISVFGFVTAILVIFTGYSSKKLSINDDTSLIYILEEEKLALDVYTHLYDKWELKQFDNIKNSEQIHVEKVQELLEKKKIKYQLLASGKFENQNLQKLFNQLIKKGNISEIDALEVGATIEDVDIFDIQKMKKETDDKEVMILYDFLECASKNHLRAFTKGLKMKDSEYKPQYISQREYQTIISGNHYPCGKLLKK